MFMTVVVFAVLVPLLSFAMDGPCDVQYRQAAHIWLIGCLAFLAVLLSARSA